MSFNTIELKGDVEATIDYLNGTQEIIRYQNRCLVAGRQAHAAVVANTENTSDFYITRMLFGDGGTSDGVKKYVNANRNGLFGVTRASRPVIATINPSVPTQVMFVSVLPRDEANGFALNEMALEMANGDLYSMTTFADLNKTDQMQITYVWRLSFI